VLTVCELNVHFVGLGVTLANLFYFSESKECQKKEERKKNWWCLPFVRICDITLFFQSESGLFCFCYIFVTDESEKKNV
jgi:hypothetical protein